MRILAVLSALVAAGIVFVLFVSPQTKEAAVQDIPRITTEEIAAERDGRYYNERYGFSFALPLGTVAHERKEGPESATVRIEDVKEGRGLQVFITPYHEETISAERFALDVPSGVRTAEEHVLLFGTPAVAFISEDARLGPLREVWVLRNGYLYEISTLLGDEVWLQEVLLTWKFEGILSI